MTSSFFGLLDYRRRNHNCDIEEISLLYNWTVCVTVLSSLTNSKGDLDKIVAYLRSFARSGMKAYNTNCICVVKVIQTDPKVSFRWIQGAQDLSNRYSIITSHETLKTPFSVLCAPVPLTNYPRLASCLAGKAWESRMIDEGCGRFWCQPGGHTVHNTVVFQLSGTSAGRWMYYNCKQTFTDQR